MTRISVIYPNFRRVQSGVSTTVFNLTPALRRRGVTVHVAGYGSPPDLPATSLRNFNLPFGASGPPVIWHARRNIEMLAGIVLRAHGANLRLVFTSAAQRQHTPYTHWLMRQMNRIVFTSSRSAAFVPIPGTVIGHGVTLPPAIDRRILKMKLGLDPDTRYVASFGAVRPDKGTDLLVDALIHSLRCRPGWRGLIVGPCEIRDLPYRGELLARVHRSAVADRIDFLGYVDDAGGYMQAVDICVAPSRSEGFGLTAIEAMASGTPVVASRAGSYSETIVDGVTGVLTATGNMADLLGALVDLMDDDGKRHALGIAARRHIERRWTVDKEAEALLHLYAELQLDDASVQL